MMEKCKRLEEYTIFVAKVRQYAIAEVLELVLTTFNRELYEQGLKEEAAREANEATKRANEEITNLKRQLEDRDMQLNKERQRIAELERQLEQLKKPYAE